MSAKNIVNRLLENEEDPKDFITRHNIVFDPLVVYACTFNNDAIEYWGGDDDDQDWQPDWSKAVHYRLSTLVNDDGALDVEELPFGCETLVVVNPDGTPGIAVPAGDDLVKYFSPIVKIVLDGGIPVGEEDDDLQV